MDGKQMEETIRCLVETLQKIVNIQFLKHLSSEEIKVIFDSIWNIAYEAKDRMLFNECKQMLTCLYEQLRKFAQYLSESKSDFDCTLLQLVMFKTLGLLADLYLVTHNYQAARQALKDLEAVKKIDADTYILKVRVLLTQHLQEAGKSTQLHSEIMETVYNLYRTENFEFNHLLVVLYEADQLRIAAPDSVHA